VAGGEHGALFPPADRPRTPFLGLPVADVIDRSYQRCSDIEVKLCLLGLADVGICFGEGRMGGHVCEALLNQPFGDLYNPFSPVICLGLFQRQEVLGLSPWVTMAGSDGTRTAACESQSEIAALYAGYQLSVGGVGLVRAHPEQLDNGTAAVMATLGSIVTDSMICLHNGSYSSYSGSLCVTVHLHDSGSRDIRRRQRSKVSYARHYRLRTAPEDMTILVVRHGPHLRLLNDAVRKRDPAPLHEVVYGALADSRFLNARPLTLIIRQHDCRTQGYPRLRCPCGRVTVTDSEFGRVWGNTDEPQTTSDRVLPDRSPSTLPVIRWKNSRQDIETMQRLARRRRGCLREPAWHTNRKLHNCEWIMPERL